MEAQAFVLSAAVSVLSKDHSFLSRLGFIANTDTRGGGC